MTLDEFLMRTFMLGFKENTGEIENVYHLHNAKYNIDIDVRRISSYKESFRRTSSNNPYYLYIASPTISLVNASNNHKTYQIAYETLIKTLEELDNE